MNAAGRPLRVLHLNSERGWRGGERQTFWLARGLSELGHDSVVAAWPRSPLAERAAGAGLDVLAAQPHFPLDPGAAFTLARTLRRERFDVLHAHTGNALTQGALAGRRPGSILVGSKRVDRGSHAGLLTRWKYARCDALIAVSGFVKQQLIDDGASAQRVAVVPDGVDLKRMMTPVPQEQLRALGVQPGQPLVVMVAALVPVKDPLMFVRGLADAAGRGAAFQALLVGDGELRDAVAAERDRLALTARLHLAGWQPHTDGFVAAADVVALTSKGEGQGSILLDAMQCSVPVIATRAGGVPDTVEDGETGLLVAPGDAAAFGAAITRLCGDEALRRRLGAAGRIRVSRFALDRTVGQTLDVYRAALSRRAAS